jgi:hypothetical protein
VNHRIFERTLRPLVFRGAHLFERHYNPQALLGIGRRPAWTRLKAFVRRGPASSVAENLALKSGSRLPDDNTFYFLRLTSDQVGIPAELKHINKRRKRNQQGLPQ